MHVPVARSFCWLALVSAAGFIAACSETDQGRLVIDMPERLRPRWRPDPGRRGRYGKTESVQIRNYGDLHRHD